MKHHGRQAKGSPAIPASILPGGTTSVARIHLPGLLLIVIVALALRIIPYVPIVFGAHGPSIADPDACYHLRRAELIMSGFPALPVFDSYMNHPFGAFIIWPPLYDLILAGLWALSSCFTSGPGVPATLPFLPPLFLTLACLVVYGTALRFWPGKRWQAAAAALVPAVLPIAVLYSTLGQLDHHAPEILAVALFTDALLQSLGKPLRKRVPLSWILAGLYLGLGLLVQHGLLLLEAVLLAGLIPLLGKKTRSQAWALAAIVNGVAFLVTVPWGLFCHLKGVPLAHTHFGLFQPLVLLTSALFASALWLTFSTPSWLARNRKLAGQAVVTALAFMLAFLLLRQTLAGTTYLVRTWSGWQAQIAESHSLLRISPARAATELGQYMSLAIFLLPLAWILMLRQWRRLSLQQAALMLMSLVFTVFGLFQLRFLTYTALFLGLFLLYLVHQVRLWWNRPKALYTGAVIVCALFYLPCISTIGKRDVIHDVHDETQPVLGWLRAKAPSDSLWMRSQRPQSYGLVCDWNLGHYVQYYGQWPVLADNFGEHATDLGRLNDFFFSTENESTYAFLDRNQVKYVLCQDLPSMYQSMILDKSMLAYVSDFNPATGSIVFDPRIYPTALCRLVWRYGSAFLDRESRLYYPPLDRLRLVAESKGRDETMRAPDVARIKLFEYVAGARTTISGLPPQATCFLSTKILTPSGRTFPYIQIQSANEHGRLPLILPYPTSPDSLGFASPYEIILDDERRILPGITEEMVESGSGPDLDWGTLPGVSGEQP